LPLDDGDALVLHHDVGKTIDSIRRFSAHDAAAFESFYAESMLLLREVIGPMRSSAPLPADERRALLSRSARGRRYLELEAQSPLELVRSLFEHEAVRAAVLFNIATRAYLPLLKTRGTGYIVPVALAAMLNTAIHPGGGGRAAAALEGAATDAGATIVTGASVARIDVQGDRATGVTLADGRTLRATRFVCSSLPPPLTFGRLLDDHSHDDYRWQQDSIFGVHLALREPPRYRVPELGSALNVCVGGTSSDAWERACDDVLGGRVPELALQTSVPTQFDPSRAPAGHATAFAWQLVPREPAARWESDVESNAFASAMLDRWRTFAPNLGDAEIAHAIHSPLDTARTVPSMVLGDRHHGSYHPDNFDDRRPDYATPIRGLYLCGSSCYPGGSFTGLPGYNAATRIAVDLGLTAWWTPQDARTALGKLA